MGVKYGREYKDIIYDLQNALTKIVGIHSFFDMTDEEWNILSKKQRMNCLQTLADDIFFGLGEESIISIHNTKIIYYSDQHIIVVQNPNEINYVISLIDSK
ncbi:MAG: hypothetical protein GX347_08020 [Epulopiscium sp.]|nr:hypothetical protein [Candidatus Epulonipiscium sp.]